MPPFTIFLSVLFISITYGRALQETTKTSRSQHEQTAYLDQHERELRTRFDLHEELEIALAYDVATEYLQKYPRGIYAGYLTMWTAAFERASKEHPTSLYKRAEVMRKWRQENWKSRNDLFTQEMKFLPDGKRRVILLTDVLDEVEARARRKQVISPPNDNFPSPPRPASLAPVDCLETENCFNANAYSLILQQVRPPHLESINARLRILEKNQSLFGCYDILVSRDEQIDIRCRYVRKVEVSATKSISEIVKLPKAWTQALKDQRITAIWLENGIRVDAEGIPLEEPIPIARPIALQTNTAMYSVAERFDSDVGSQAGHVTSFKNKIFDISQCNNRAACSDKVMSKYLQRVEAGFAQAPLAVPVIGNAEFPPGEIWLGKTKVRSTVLGLPWHEISRYVIKWYGRDAGIMLLDSGTGKGKPGNYIFLEVAQEYTLSPNINGTYKDAAPAQESRYKQNVDRTVRQALAEACNDLGGNMINEVLDNEARNVCVITRRQQ